MRIETERLLLRPMGPVDLEDFLDLHGERSVIEFLGPATRESAAARLALCQERWRRGDFDLMAVLERSSDRFVGRAGVKYWPEFNETEAGWAFHRDARGKGYATEAARASITWAFDALPVSYITAMIRPDNSRSMAVARRLGLTPIREDVVVGIPVIVHAIGRAAWLDQAAARPSHDPEIEPLLAHVGRWAQGRPDLVAVALVGSRARGTARIDSDLDLVFLSRDPDLYTQSEDWAHELGAGEIGASARRGVLLEQRLRMASGLELDVGIGPPRWASVAPLDDGTKRVASQGLRIVYDPEGVLAGLQRAVGG